MNRKEAMEMAVEIVDKWSMQPTKSNGYPVDGWKQPTLIEKTEAAERLASFLWEVEDDTTSLPTLSGKDFADAPGTES